MNELKIIQILSVPESNQWPSNFLGLASNGVTYVHKDGKWREFAENIKLEKEQGK